MQGRQSAEIAEILVDGGESLKKSLREADRIIVLLADLLPHKSQLRMGGGPLSEKN